MHCGEAFDVDKDIQEHWTSVEAVGTFDKSRAEGDMGTTRSTEINALYLLLNSICAASEMDTRMNTTWMQVAFEKQWKGPISTYTLDVILKWACMTN